MGSSSNFVFGGRNLGRLSSASNLSASAPPFRSMGKSFSDSYYSITTFSEGWQYPQPSAPVSESMMDSTGIDSSVSLPPEYQYLYSAYGDSTAVWSPVIPATEVSGIEHGYASSKTPSYSPSLPMFYGDHDMKLEGEGSRATKLPIMPSSFDLECGLQGVGGLGFHVGKHAKIVEPGRDFLSFKERDGGLGYSNQLNHSVPAVYKSSEDFWESPAIQKYKYQDAETSNLSYQKCDEFGNSSCSNGNMVKNSYPGENQGGFPYYFIETQIPETSSTNTHHGASKVDGISEDVSTWNVNSRFGDANNAWSLHKSPSGSVSAVRSSPAVIIRPPPAVLTGKSGKNTICNEGASAGNSNYRFAVDSNQSNMSKQQDLGVKPDSETQKNSYGTSASNFSVKGGGCIASASQEMSDRFVQTKDNLGNTTNARVSSQVSELDSSNGSSISCNKFEAVKLCKDSSNIADNQNLEVDSPCWKGAPSSHISFFDIEDRGCNIVKKAGDEQEHGKHHAVDHSLVVPTLITLQKTLQDINDSKNECIHAVGIADLHLRKEKHLIEATKPKFDIPTVEGDTLEVSGYPNMRIDRMNDCEVKIPELMEATGEAFSVMVVNDASEGESTAVHVAEEALSSPVSQDNAAEHIKLRDSRLNVATMIKALHNISELLLVHFSSDGDSIENEEIEDVKKVISNLNLCLSKKLTGTIDEPEPGTLDGGIPHFSRESLDLNKIPEDPIMAEESRNLQNETMSQQTQSGSRNCSISCEKNKKCSHVSVRHNDSALIADDDMAKGIKKVLEDNFDFNEEMQAQALLFKNLWLEAESKLCSLIFKANFNRMRIQMEEMQLKDSSNSIITPSELQTQKDRVVQLDPTPDTQNISMFSPSMHADDIESSVMARFDILKSRKETVAMEDEQKTEAFGDNPADSFMASLSPLKSPGTSSILSISKGKELRSESISGESDYQKYFELGFQPEDETMICNVEKSNFLLHGHTGFRNPDDFYLSFVNHPTSQSYKNEGLGSRNNSVLQDSFSLDWEHVPKDECLWKNS